MKGFYHIWAWRPSWSCDLDFAIKLEMPLPKKAPHKISTRSAKRFQRRSLKLWTTPTDGRTPDHGHPISSPCEPFVFSRNIHIESKRGKTSRWVTQIRRHVTVGLHTTQPIMHQILQYTRPGMRPRKLLSRKYVKGQQMYIV